MMYDSFCFEISPGPYFEAVSLFPSPLLNGLRLTLIHHYLGNQGVKEYFLRCVLINLLYMPETDALCAVRTQYVQLSHA